MRIGPGEVRLAIQGIGEESPSGWLVHERYVVFGGRISPADPSKLRRQYSPLRDHTLFTSFARLSVGGEPSTDAAMGWTREYGLLRAEGTDVAELRAASKDAHRSLSLLELIRARDTAALRSRISYRDRRVLLDREGTGVLQYREHKARGVWKVTRRGGKRVSVLEISDERDPEPYEYPDADDEMMLFYAVRGLERMVSGKLSGVRKVFGAGDDETPRQLAGWAPRLDDECPDLLSALWYQFARFIEDRRPLRRCEVCPAVFVPERSTKKTCSDACRQAKSRRDRRSRA